MPAADSLTRNTRKDMMSKTLTAMTKNSKFASQTSIPMHKTSNNMGRRNSQILATTG